MLRSSLVIQLLRAQHLEEIIAYDKKLVDAVTDAANREGSTSLPLATYREVLQVADPEVTRANIWHSPHGGWVKGGPLGIPLPGGMHAGIHLPQLQTSVHHQEECLSCGA